MLLKEFEPLRLNPGGGTRFSLGEFPLLKDWFIASLNDCDRWIYVALV